jgi:hypothetical protein
MRKIVIVNAAIAAFINPAFAQQDPPMKAGLSPADRQACRVLLQQGKEALIRDMHDLADGKRGDRYESVRQAYNKWCAP